MTLQVWVLCAMLILQLHFQNMQLIFTVLLVLPSLQVVTKPMDLVYGACLYLPIHKTCLLSPHPLMPTKPHCNILVLITFLVWKRQFGTSMQPQVSLSATHDLKPSSQETFHRGRDSPTRIQPSPTQYPMRSSRYIWFRCAKAYALPRQIHRE